MAVRVEPPRGRSGSSEASRYPGLTAEERGLEPPFPPPLEPVAVPSSLAVPLAATPLVDGLAERRGAPEASPDLPPSSLPSASEGLFDVPGLLERLWLARALEVHRARSFAVAPPHPPSPGVPRTLGAPAADLPPGRLEAESSAPRLTEPGRSTGAAEAPRSLPLEPAPRKSWVCPYCYLANDRDATTCRGCRSGNLHL